MPVEVLLPDTYFSPNDIAHAYKKHPSAPIRWITRGVLLSTGQRLRLQAIRTPGSWLVREDWLAAFIAALTADRQTGPDETTAPRMRQSTKQRAELERVDRALVEAGF
jgi:hypothetical protein